MNSHPPSTAELAAAGRLLKIIYFVLFATVGIYWVVLETLAPGLSPREPGPVRTILQGLGAALGAGALYLRFARIPQLLDAFSSEPASALARLRVHYIVCFALIESVALYGFVLRFLGGTREETAAFFLGAAALFLLCYPRLPTSPGSLD